MAGDPKALPGSRPFPAGKWQAVDLGVQTERRVAEGVLRATGLSVWTYYNCRKRLPR